MPIFRRKICIHTASGIVALCKRLHSNVLSLWRNIILAVPHKNSCKIFNRFFGAGVGGGGGCEWRPLNILYSSWANLFIVSRKKEFNQEFKSLCSLPGNFIRRQLTSQENKQFVLSLNTVASPAEVKSGMMWEDKWQLRNWKFLEESGCTLYQNTVILLGWRRRKAQNRTHWRGPEETQPYKSHR